MVDVFDASLDTQGVVTDILHKTDGMLLILILILNLNDFLIGPLFRTDWPHITVFEFMWASVSLRSATLLWR